MYGGDERRPREPTVARGAPAVKQDKIAQLERELAQAKVAKLEAELAKAFLPIDDAFRLAVSNLRGSTLGLAICSQIVAISAIFTLVGLCVMTEDDSCDRSLSLMAVLFLVSQAFSFAKVSQNRKMAMVIPMGPHKSLMPTEAEYWLLLVFFLLALSFTIYALTQVKWAGFAVMAVVWVLVSSLSLAKYDRDRRDAVLWEALPPESREGHLRHVFRACSGPWEFRVFFWVAFLGALGGTLIWVWFAWTGNSTAGISAVPSTPTVLGDATSVTPASTVRFNQSLNNVTHACTCISGGASSASLPSNNITVSGNTTVTPTVNSTTTSVATMITSIVATSTVVSLSLDQKLILTLFLFCNVATTFCLQRLLQDLGRRENSSSKLVEDNDLLQQVPNQVSLGCCTVAFTGLSPSQSRRCTACLLVMAITMCLVSVLGGVIMVLMLNLETEQHFCLVLGQLAIASTSWILAKQMGDLHGVKVLTSRLPAIHRSLIENVPTKDAIEQQAKGALKNLPSREYRGQHPFGQRSSSAVDPAPTDAPKRRAPPRVVPTTAWSAPSSQVVPSAGLSPVMAVVPISSPASLSAAFNGGPPCSLTLRTAQTIN